MEMIDYECWRQKQAERRETDADGKQIWIGIASFTEVAGADNSRKHDIAGLEVFDSAKLRIPPTGKAILKLSLNAEGTKRPQ